MPIVKEVKLERFCVHRQKPSVSLYGIGTIWQCDDCQQRFELKDCQRDGKYWSPTTYSGWKG